MIEYFINLKSMFLITQKNVNLHFVLLGHYFEGPMFNMKLEV